MIVHTSSSIYQKSEIRTQNFYWQRSLTMPGTQHPFVFASSFTTYFLLTKRMLANSSNGPATKRYRLLHYSKRWCGHDVLLGLLCFFLFSSPSTFRTLDSCVKGLNPILKPSGQFKSIVAWSTEPARLTESTFAAAAGSGGEEEKKENDSPEVMW